MRLVLGGEFAEAAAEFRCREGFNFGAFRTDGGEEAGVGAIQGFEGMKV